MRLKILSCTLIDECIGFTCGVWNVSCLWEESQKLISVLLARVFYLRVPQCALSLCDRD